jgi:cysteine-rich repeat protein/parallel beta-helix repeat protein
MPYYQRKRGIFFVITILIAIFLVIFFYYGVLIWHHHISSAADFNYVVDDLGDEGDSVIDGVCDNGDGECTLRAALQEASLDAGSSEITFSVTGTINVASNLEIQNFTTITGPGALDKSLSDDLIIDFGNLTSLSINETSITVQGLTITNSNGVCVSIQGSNTTLHNNIINNCQGEAIIISPNQDISNVAITGNTISDYGLADDFTWRDNALDIFTGEDDLTYSNITVSDNEITGEPDDAAIAVVIQTGANNTTFEHFTFDSNIINEGQTGISVSGNYPDNPLLNDFVITNNILTDQTTGGIVLSSATDANIGSNNISSTVTAAGANSIGIYPSNVSESTIENNTVSNTFDYGLALVGLLENNTISTNDINNTRSACIVILGEGGGNSFTGNTVSDSTSSSGIYIQLAGDNNSFTNNEISGSGGVGVEINDSGANTVFTGNTVTNSGDEGIIISSLGANSSFTNNIIDGSGTWGVEVGEGVTNAITFTGNTVTNNGAVPITGYLGDTLMFIYNEVTYASGMTIYVFGSGFNAEILNNQNPHYLTSPDGINNFHLALTTIHNWGEWAELPFPALIRADAFDNPEDWEAECTSWNLGPDYFCTVEKWVDDVWLAQGVGNDYSWSLTDPEVTYEDIPTLVYRDDIYLYAGYYVKSTQAHTWENETITGNAYGVNIDGDNVTMTITDSVITGSVEADLVHDADPDRVGRLELYNTIFGSYSDYEGSYRGNIYVYYTARVHTFNLAGGDVSGAAVSAEYSDRNFEEVNGTVDFGITDVAGLTGYQNLLVENITEEGSELYYYQFSVDHPTYDPRQALSRITTPNQQIEAVLGFNLLTPNGDTDEEEQAFVIGEETEITWDDLSIPNIKIEYSTDGFIDDIQTIVASVANIGSYTWTIPNDPGDTLLVRVSDAANATIWDTSDNFFAIVPGLVTITNPTNEAELIINSTEELIWTNTGTINTVDILFSASGNFDDVVTVASNIANTGSYSWTVLDSETATGALAVACSTAECGDYWDLTSGVVNNLILRHGGRRSYQCSDGQDNDSDGKIDYPADPGCANSDDEDEISACADGLDNDSDGKTDYPLDPGCTDISDNDEANLLPQCTDGLDNDSDGLIDMQDSGCSSLEDNDEANLLPQCTDGLDNDSDTFIDYPSDLGCSSLTDNDETNFVCGNNLKEGSETCDEGVLNGTPNHCNATCTGITTPVCGNSVLEAEEECDTNLSVPPGYVCTFKCKLTLIPKEPVCGDGIKSGQESCDDGDLNNTPNHCNSTCTGITTPVCGNQVQESKEECDTTAPSGYTCTARCKLQKVTPKPICGNNILETGETCDDGNLVSGNGCSGTCQTEQPKPPPENPPPQEPPNEEEPGGGANQPEEASPGSGNINETNTNQEFPLANTNHEVLDTNEEILESGVVTTITQTLKETFKPLTQIKLVQTAQARVLDNPQVETVNQNIAVPAIVAVNMVNTAVAFPGVLAFFSYLQFVFTEPLRFLFFRRRKYGVVYNSITKQPLDLAIVRFYNNETNKLISTQVTDRQGRYSFIGEPGEYYLKVQKNDYIFPSSTLGARIKDQDYADLYYGAPLRLTDQNTMVGLNIPLDPNLPQQSDQQVLKEKKTKNFQKTLAYIGPALALVSFVISPTKLVAGILIVHAVLFYFFRRLTAAFHPKSFGAVFDVSSSQALKNTIVRIFDTQYNKLLATRVTNSRGQYNFLVGPNSYYLTANHPAYQPYRSPNLDLSQAKETIVDQDLGLEKLIDK